MAGQALKIGLITAAVAGTVAIPATALAANASGAHLRTFAESTIDAQRGGGAKELRTEHLQGLATSLGVSVDTLKAAMEATRTELATQPKPTTPAERQAAQEKHTATLAAKLNVTVDALKAAQEANRPERPAQDERRGPGGPGGGHGMPGIPGLGGALNEGADKVAASLGITSDALKTAVKAALEQTKPTTKPADEAARTAHQQAVLAAVAAKLNVSVTQLQSAIDAAKPTTAEQRSMLSTRLGQMVTNGKLTQVQADKILADFDAGKPVMEILKQFMPQLEGHGPGQQGQQRAPRGAQGQRAPGQGA